jgi:hypothetical protein
MRINYFGDDQVQSSDMAELGLFLYNHAKIKVYCFLVYSVL